MMASFTISDEASSKIMFQVVLQWDIFPVSATTVAKQHERLILIRREEQSKAWNDFICAYSHR